MVTFVRWVIVHRRLMPHVDQTPPANSGPRDLDFRRRSLRLNNPVQMLYGTPESAAVSTASVEAYQDSFLTEYAPMESASGLPLDLHLLSLVTRDGISDDVIIRFQSIGYETDWKHHVEDLFSRAMGFKAAQLRETTLSVNQDVPVGSYPKAHLRFKGDTGGSSMLSFLFYKRPDNSAERQNTEEEGVFISQAAMDRQSRKLLSIGVRDDERGALSFADARMVSVDASTLSNYDRDARSVDSLGWADASATFVTESTTQRHLLQAGPQEDEDTGDKLVMFDVGTNTLVGQFEVSALQIRSYVMSLHSSEMHVLSQGEAAPFTDRSAISTPHIVAGPDSPKKERPTPLPQQQQQQQQQQLPSLPAIGAATEARSARSEPSFAQRLLGSFGLASTRAPELPYEQPSLSSDGSLEHHKVRPVWKALFFLSSYVFFACDARDRLLLTCITSRWMMIVASC